MSTESHMKSSRPSYCLPVLPVRNLIFIVIVPEDPAFITGGRTNFKFKKLCIVNLTFLDSIKTTNGLYGASNATERI